MLPQREETYRETRFSLASDFSSARSRAEGKSARTRNQEVNCKPTHHSSVRKNNDLFRHTKILVPSQHLF